MGNFEVTSTRDGLILLTLHQIQFPTNLIQFDNLVFIFLILCVTIEKRFILGLWRHVVNIFRSIGETFNSVVDSISEKKRKFDKKNRIKNCIKQETVAMVKKYIKLGKYYYSELRNVPNKDMQRICSDIDSCKCEIKRLKYKLEEIDNGCDIKCYCGSIDNDSDVCSESFCSTCSTPCNEYSEDISSCCACDPVCNCSANENCYGNRSSNFGSESAGRSCCSENELCDNECDSSEKKDEKL